MKISLEEASERLKRGEVIAVPTETVYGLAASIYKPEAIDEIFALKKRPSNNPLIVHVASTEQIRDFVDIFPAGFDTLAFEFWPGPLSIVLPLADDKIPLRARGGLSTAAFRVPNHPKTLQLLKETGPLVMPSANLSGKPSATRIEHVESDFGENFPVLDGGICVKGLESTILIHREGKWEIIRLGSLSPDDFFEILRYSPEVNIKSSAPLCPGQLYRHYAPKCKLILDPTSREGNVILGFKERDYPQSLRKITLGSLHHPEEVGENLYFILRQLDVENIETALVDIHFPKVGLWGTILERLHKAAN